MNTQNNSTQRWARSALIIVISCLLLALCFIWDPFGAEVIRPGTGSGSGTVGTNAVGTANHLAIFTGTNNLRDSIATQQGTTNITVPGTLSVNGLLIRGSGNDTNDLSIAIGTAGTGNGATNTGNVAIGSGALSGLTTGNSNLGIGKNAGAGLDTGYDNTIIGTSAGGGGSSRLNTALGKRALSASTTSSNNVAIGAGASSGSISGSGAGITTGVGNIILGYASGGITTGSRNTLIGEWIVAPNATNDNQLAIANAIFGTGLEGTNTTVSTGKIGIMTNAPGYTLDVAGTLGVAGTITGSSDINAGATGIHGWTGRSQMLAPFDGGLTLQSSSGFARFVIGASGVNSFINSTSTNIVYVYGTFTDSSNYERGFIAADSAGLHIGHEALGTGTGGPVNVWGGGSVMSRWATNGDLSMLGNNEIILQSGSAINFHGAGSSGTSYSIYKDGTDFHYYTPESTLHRFTVGTPTALSLNLTAAVFAGVVSSPGISSSNVTALTLTATGITNSAFNSYALISGTNVTYVLHDSAGAFWTNLDTVSIFFDRYIPLQASGKIVVTSGTITGIAKPF